MKKIILLFSFVLFSAIAHAQTQGAVIKGKTDGSTPYLVLAWEEQYGIINTTDTIQVNQDQSFEHQAKLKEPTLGFLIIGDNGHNVWLEPGSLLSIDLKNEQPVFSGDAGVYATYFQEDQRFFSNIYEDYIRKHPEYRNSSEDEIAYMDAMTAQRLTFLKDYQHEKGVSGGDEFIKQAELLLISQNLLGKLSYSKPESFKFYQDKYKTGNQSYYTYSDKVNLKDTLLLSNPYYRKFISQFIGDVARSRHTAEGQKFAIEPYLEHAMLVVDKLTEEASINPKIKAVFLNNLVEEIERRKKMEWTGPVNATLVDLTSRYDDTNLQLVQAKLDRITAVDARFSKGNPAPAFTLKDAKGKSYTLQDFKGKKVYMDMGAAWCGWCIKGVPAWNRLVEENAKNKDVVFISVGMDEKEAAWREWTEKHKLKGLLLYAGEGGLKSKFGMDYHVESLPRFVVLDEEGKIEAFAAPTPEQLREEFLSQKVSK